MMKVHTLPLGPIETNCYIVESDQTVIIIDPGAQADKVFGKINKINKPVAAVLLTHAHFDHIGAVDEVVGKYNVPLLLNQKEHEWLVNPEYNGSKKYEMYGFAPIIMNSVPQNFEEQHYQFDDIEFSAKKTPGHSPGSISLIFEDFAIVGDTLFEGSIGRTDLKEGNHAQLLESIRKVLLELDEDTIIYPGHGSATTIGHEMDTNPFINGFA